TGSTGSATLPSTPDRTTAAGARRDKHLPLVRADCVGKQLPKRGDSLRKHAHLPSTAKAIRRWLTRPGPGYLLFTAGPPPRRRIRAVALRGNERQRQLKKSPLQH